MSAVLIRLRHRVRISDPGPCSRRPMDQGYSLLTRECRFDSGREFQFLGGRLMVSRQSLKLASGVRFAPSQPSPP